MGEPGRRGEASPVMLRRERALGDSATARRNRRVNLSFNELEYAVIRAAAGDLAPGAWAAQTVLAVARGTVVPVPTNDREALRALAEARVAVNRIGTNLNQITAAMNAAAVAGEGSQEAVTAEQVAAVLARTMAALHRLDLATMAIVQR
jgi:hypothetical protein